MILGTNESADQVSILVLVLAQNQKVRSSGFWCILLLAHW